MPALQVKDCPQNVYQQLKTCAKRDNRSLTQEMLAIFEWYFASQQGARQGNQYAAVQCAPTTSKASNPYAEQVREDGSPRRKAIAKRIASLEGYTPSGDGKSPSDLVRECREEAR